VTSPHLQGAFLLQYSFQTLDIDDVVYKYKAYRTKPAGRCWVPSSPGITRALQIPHMLCLASYGKPLQRKDRQSDP
jgi:hypothetical protein